MTIVTNVIGDCPGCAGPACFGNVLVARGSTLIRGCRRCDYRQQIRLPVLRKKIVYLDQSLLSSAFKARDTRSVEAVQRVSDLASKQLLTAPHSDIHEDETHLWSGYAQQTPRELLAFIKNVARGLRLNSHHEVERRQAYRALRAFCANAPPAYTLEQSDVFRDDPHEWHGYVYFSTQRGPIGLDDQRSEKSRAVQNMVNAFEAWRSTTCTFEEDVAFEIRDAGKTFIREYLKSVAQILSGDMSAIMSQTTAAQCTRSLLDSLRGEMSAEDALRKVGEFFESAHFAQMPQIAVGAHIFAQLKQMARSGAYPSRESAEYKLSGTLDDVRHVATYAPYCHAIFVDNTMADIVGRPSVGLTQRYGTMVFSLSSLEQFHAWLDKVEESATDEHREALERVYGDRP